MIEAKATVTQGKLQLDRQAFDRMLKTLKDGKYLVTVTPAVNNISHQQRKYFFGVVVKELRLGFLDAGTVLSTQQIIDYLKHEFIYREEYNPITDTVIKTPISLGNNDKGLTKEEFDRIKLAIQQHAAEVWNIIIPDPNEIDYSSK